MSEGQLDLVGTWVRVLSLRTRLLGWYDRSRRDLPWRRDRDPYRILVSEMMLQQTRVDVVVPYYERWVGRWADHPGSDWVRRIYARHRGVSAETPD